jgi:hypothetical protein
MHGYESRHVALSGPLERLWLSAAELRLVADELGSTVVVVADVPGDLAEIVKERRRRAASALREQRG